MTSPQGRTAESLRAFVAVLRNRNLRRLQLALVGSITGYWAFKVAVGVYAFQRHGASAVGLIALAQFLPNAVASPFAAVLADHYPRRLVMVASDLIRAIALVATGATIAAGGPFAVVCLLVALVGLGNAAFRPAQSAILPSLAGTPDELTAANVVSSTIESASMFVGPAIGGVLLAATDAKTVIWFCAATCVWSAALVAGISVGAPAERAPFHARQVLSEVGTGFRAAAGSRPVRLVIGLYSAQTFVCGMLNVLLVVIALDMLGTGESGVGYLTSAVGVGGVLGALVAATLVGRRGLATYLGIGLLLWGAPIVVLGGVPRLWLAVLMLGLVGIGNTLVDVAGLTLLQRAVPDDVLGRVFGILEFLLITMIAVGGPVASGLISAIGVRGALVATGCVLPVLLALTWRPLRNLEAQAAPASRELAVIGRLPLFMALPGPVLEAVAAKLVRSSVPAGTEVVRQGAMGDRFYVIGSGEADVVSDGKHVATLGPNEYFGEIALLRDVPRTATVTADTELELYALDRDEFLAAVTGHSSSLEAADAVMSTRLASLRPGIASV